MFAPLNFPLSGLFSPNKNSERASSLHRCFSTMYIMLHGNNYIPSSLLLCLCYVQVAYLLFVSPQAHVSKMSESCSSLHSSLASLASSGVTHPASLWREDTASLSSALTTFAGSQKTSMAAARKTVSRYISQEISVDVPTGTLYYTTCRLLLHKVLFMKLYM